MNARVGFYFTAQAEEQIKISALEALENSGKSQEPEMQQRGENEHGAADKQRPFRAAALPGPALLPCGKFCRGRIC
jgi:hypothetical protein